MASLTTIYAVSILISSVFSFGGSFLGSKIFPIKNDTVLAVEEEKPAVEEQPPAVEEEKPVAEEQPPAVEEEKPVARGKCQEDYPELYNILKDSQVTETQLKDPGFRDQFFQSIKFDKDIKTIDGVPIRKILLACHPDKNANDIENTEAIAKILNMLYAYNEEEPAFEPEPEPQL